MNRVPTLPYASPPGTRHRDLPGARLSDHVAAAALGAVVATAVAVGVIGLSVLLPGLSSNGTVRPKERSALGTARAIEATLNRFRADNGRYPTPAEGITALLERPGDAPGWDGPHIEGGMPLDPWGQAFVYRVGVNGSEGCEVRSKGPDMVVDTEDDLIAPSRDGK
ncbi:MAG: xcpT 11 [Phycisphaerales bacterium]|nr:xcpT 11 [Phycisphaerales bacterium]